MKVILRLTLITLLFISTSAFPTSTWKTYSIREFNPTIYTFLPTVVDTSSGDVILYSQLLSKSGIQYLIYCFNGSAPTPVQLSVQNMSIPGGMSNVNIVLSNNEVLVSFYEGASASIAALQKLTLRRKDRKPVLKRIGGVYIAPYDYLIYHIQNEIIVASPLSGSVQKLNYTTPTNDILNMKFMATVDNLYLISLYTDLNFIYWRKLVSDVDTFAVDYLSPHQITTPGTGFQCACFTSDQTTLYILDNDGRILALFLSNATLSIFARTNYSSVTDCYYQANGGGIVFVWANSSMKFMDVAKKAETNTYTTNEGNFYVDSTQAYITMAESGAVNVYAVGKTVTCSDGKYASSTFQCVSCSTGCSICSSGTICSSCSTGYSLSSSTCVVDVLPINNTLPINPGNSTYNTSNTSNISNTSNTSNTANACNTSNFLIKNSYQSKITFLETMLEGLVTNQGVQGVNKIPGGRKLVPFLCFLVSIDQLWLYQYHERNYGSFMGKLFQGIQSLENQKWKLLEDQTTDTIYRKLGTSKDQIFSVIDSKLNYTQPKFKQMEGRGETLLPACWEFLTFNFFFVLFGFVLLRWGFKLLKKYKISKLLKPFSFFLYLTPLLLDGNLQYFFFLLFAQVRMGFSLSPRDKALNVLNYLVFFFVVWFSVVSCFLAYWLSRRLSEYILDNWRTRMRGLLTYSMMSAVRMLIFGGVHSLLRNHWVQLPLLFGFEAFYVLFLLFSMSYWKAHKVAFKIWFITSFSLLRMTIQLTLIFQQRQGVVGTGSELQSMFEVILAFILSIYMFLIYIATAWELVYEIIDLIKSCQKKENPPQRPGKKINEKKEKRGECEKQLKNKNFPQSRTSKVKEGEVSKTVKVYEKGEEKHEFDKKRPQKTGNFLKIITKEEPKINLKEIVDAEVFS